MINRLQTANNNSNGYFSQAIADYARNNRPKEGRGGGAPKTIDEFSKKEWDKLLEKVDHAIEEYKDDLKRQEEEALEKQKEQRESYILGSGGKKEREFTQSVMVGDCFRTMRFMKIDGMGEETYSQPEKLDTENDVKHMVTQEAIEKLLDKGRRAPYSFLADENGIIEYKGVVFQCDFEKNRICLGDVSDPQKCIAVSLEKGGCLMVNRENIDDLVKAIGMFSPEDINRILRAISQDAKVRQTQAQIEDEFSGEQVRKNPKEEKEDESKQQSVQSHI